MNKNLLFLLLFIYSTHVNAQDIVANASLSRYECGKSIIVKIEIYNNSNSNILFDNCFAPNYVMNGVNKFNFSICRVDDSLSIVYPATVLQLVNLTMDGQPPCLINIKPHKTIFIYVDLIKEFVPNKITDSEHIASISFKTAYYKGTAKQFLFFNKKLFRIDKNKCFIKIIDY